MCFLVSVAKIRGRELTLHLIGLEGDTEAVQNIEYNIQRVGTTTNHRAEKSAGKWFINRRLRLTFLVESELVPGM